MNLQEQFDKAVLENNINEVKKILKNKNNNTSEEDNYVVHLAIDLGYTEIIELILNDLRFNYIFKNKSIFFSVINNGHTDIIKLLLNYKIIDPTYNHNFAIYLANKNKNREIVEILWEDKRVKDSLKKDDEKLYNKLIQKEIKNKIKNF